MEEWHSVGSLDGLRRKGGRMCVEVLGRAVAVFLLPDAAKSGGLPSRSGRLHSGRMNEAPKAPYTRRDKRLFAIDSRCYRAPPPRIPLEALNRERDGIAGTALTEADTGGPLEQGDIEDIGGSTYVICPWHRYVISVEDGNSIYYDMQKNVKSKGIRQRTHRVKEENGEVFVQLTKLPGGEDEIPSDHYCPATDEEKRRMGLMPK